MCEALRLRTAWISQRRCCVDCDGCSPSYYAIRVRRSVSAAAWWSPARNAGESAPDAVQAILAGCSRVEVSAHEANDLLAWARTLDGWDACPDEPLFVYPSPPPKLKPARWAAARVGPRGRH
jgi:hypothetical protein